MYAYIYFVRSFVRSYVRSSFVAEIYSTSILLLKLRTRLLIPLTEASESCALNRSTVLDEDNIHVGRHARAFAPNGPFSKTEGISEKNCTFGVSSLGALERDERILIIFSTAVLESTRKTSVHNAAHRSENTRRAR